MISPILATKLYIPPLRPKIVPRPRLIKRLNEGLHGKLTLISAPAGFGKTTLVSEWVNQKDEGERMKTDIHPSRVAWLSLDEGDNDLNHFLAYLVAALQTIAANFGEEVLEILQSPPPVPTEPVLTALVNEIAAILDNFLLVLDDYHVIDAEPVDDAITFLIERLPPQIHLVIATREDPDLPLARLRVRDQLTELRVTDLRFTPSEAAGFLNQVMGLHLSAEDITALETRTEGWIAGLQLAAISMQGQQSPTSFIQSFTGSHRFVLDYLVEEVLYQQPESVQTFLLRTSILDRMCASLCDEILEISEPRIPNIQPPVSSQHILEQLEAANIFLTPLDGERRWYRYHHLFADVLQTRLMKEQPNQVPYLHRRACEWYEQNDLRSNAIRHALAAEDFERAAGLIELEWSVIRRSCFQSPAWLGWVKALPDELVRARPVLSVGYAWELLSFGELEAAEVQMRDAERWLEPTTDLNGPPEAGASRPFPSRTNLEGMVVVNEEEFPSLRGVLAGVRAYHAQALGDVSGTVKHARRALALVSEADDYTRGMASFALGFASWTGGDLKSAHRFIADGMASLQKAGNILFALWGTILLADIRMEQGRLCESVSTYEQSLQLAAEQGEPVIQGTASLYLGLSEAYLERGDLEAASQNLLKSKELGEQTALPDWQYRLCHVQARIKQTRGDLEGALHLLDKADRLSYSLPTPDVHPIPALKARVWIWQGRLAEALSWVRERGLSVDDELNYLREFEHITLARALISRYKSGREERLMNEVMQLLERLLKASEQGERKRSTIEILILQALALQAQGDIPSAFLSLERALTLAEPEGYVRIFVDEGPPMASLLTRMKVEGRTMKAYIHKLLAALRKKKEVHPFGSVQDKPSSVSPQLLVEPLSKRELDVLRLLRTELNGPEIARELMVSLNTMRTHTKSIYNKLGVNNRRAAVRRAEELDLF